jgi:hypothetical protein
VTVLAASSDSVLVVGVVGSQSPDHTTVPDVPLMFAVKTTTVPKL